MASNIRIGLIGDFSPAVKAHIAIPRAVALVAKALACAAETSSLATPLLEHNTAELLSAYDALWRVPASPYARMEGAASAISLARAQNITFLGTCGDSPTATLELARN